MLLIIFIAPLTLSALNRTKDKVTARKNTIKSLNEMNWIEKGKTTHDTLGKDKVSFDKVLSESLKLIN